MSQLSVAASTMFRIEETGIKYTDASGHRYSEVKLLVTKSKECLRSNTGITLLLDDYGNYYDFSRNAFFSPNIVPNTTFSDFCGVQVILRDLNMAQFYPTLYRLENENKDES